MNSVAAYLLLVLTVLVVYREFTKHIENEGPEDRYRDSL